MLEFLKTAFKFVAQGLGTAVGGSVITAGVNLFVGGMLSLINKPDHTLDQQQVAELQKMNNTLIGVRQDLGKLDADLDAIEKTLEEILGQARLQTWLVKYDTISDALAHIETDFTNYIGWITPDSSGQLPKVQPAQLQQLSRRAYISSGMNDEQAVTQIQQAMLGGGAGDGLIDLYADLLIDRMKMLDPAKVSSTDLETLAQGLISYFARLVGYQLDGMSVVIECKRMDNLDLKLVQRDWQGFQDSLKSQGEALLDALWRLIIAWRQVVQANTTLQYVFQLPSFLYSQPAGTFTNNDLLDFVSGQTNSLDQFPKGMGTWFNANYPAVVRSPEQEYFVTAENLLAAVSLTEQMRRVVIHVLFYVGINQSDPAFKAFCSPIPLESVKTQPAVTVRSGATGDHFYNNALWVRQVFDLSQDGTHKMANVNATVPSWQGYTEERRGTYRFQADADLGLSVSVNADNPVGIIRFVPFIQAT